jgi:hypothetical protein
MEHDLFLITTCGRLPRHLSAEGSSILPGFRHSGPPVLGYCGAISFVYILCRVEGVTEGSKFWAVRARLVAWRSSPLEPSSAPRAPV